MTDYSKACVYKIICKDSSITDIYIGSTINFKSRGYLHKHHCNNPNSKKYNSKAYKFIRENGGWDNWQMIKICDVKCLDKYDLRKKEGEYILSFKSTLNTQIAGRTKEESWRAYSIKNKDRIKAYRSKNKDKMKEYCKAYYLNNIDKSRRDRREYYKKNKDAIKVYQEVYRAKNKDAVKVYQEVYRAKNKDKNKAYMKAYMKAYRAKKKLLKSKEII